MDLHGPTDAIDDQTYPITSSELLDELGDAELELVDGTESVATVLERFGDQTFQTPEAVRHTLQAGVCERAIGRKGYSDRDPTTPGSVYGHDCVSF